MSGKCITDAQHEPGWPERGHPQCPTLGVHSDSAALHRLKRTRKHPAMKSDFNSCLRGAFIRESVTEQSHSKIISTHYNSIKRNLARTRTETFSERVGGVLSATRGAPPVCGCTWRCSHLIILFKVHYYYMGPISLQSFKSWFTILAEFGFSCSFYLVDIRINLETVS